MKPKHAREVVGNRGPARSGATSAWFRNSGCARVRRGAFGSCPGAFREAFGVGACGLWPGNPPTPSRRVGSWRKRAPGTRGSVEELFSRAWGEVGWEAKEGTWATGVPAGGCAIRCSPHTPRRFPRGWEGQGSTRVRLRAARRVFRIPGSDFGCHFRPSQHYFRPTLAFRRADKPRIQQS